MDRRICSPTRLTKRCRRNLLLGSVATTMILSLAFLQIYSSDIGQRTIEIIRGGRGPQLDVTRLYPQPDPDLYTDPYEIKDICNKLSNARKHPRGLLITDKTSEEPLKIFYWRQITYADQVDWKKESKTVCPFPPELQPFFNYLWDWHIKDEKMRWEQGYAPCWFWTRNIGEWDRDRVQTCDIKSSDSTGNSIINSDTQQYKFISSSNYTEFRDADIIYVDYPFYNYIQRPPFWDQRRMPPRVAHQRWVLEFGRESIGSYAHVGLPSFLQQFDLTIGAPGQLFDVPYPLMPIPKDLVLKLASVPPSVAVETKLPEDLMAWVISNCEPRNNRNEVMKELVDKIGAHSYGTCQHNKDLPEALEGEPWTTTKFRGLKGYPFTLAAENSNCLGYITEKIYDAFETGAIPIYIGASDISDFVPAGSFISMSDFENTDELIQFLKTVDRTKYYSWKEEVKADYTKFCKNCHLPTESIECRILNHVRFV